MRSGATVLRKKSKTKRETIRIGVRLLSSSSLVLRCQDERFALRISGCNTQVGEVDLYHTKNRWQFQAGLTWSSGEDMVDGFHMDTQLSTGRIGMNLTMEKGMDRTASHMDGMEDTDWMSSAHTGEDMQWMSRGCRTDFIRKAWDTLWENIIHTSGMASNTTYGDFGHSFSPLSSIVSSAVPMMFPHDSQQSVSPRQQQFETH